MKTLHNSSGGVIAVSEDFFYSLPRKGWEDGKGMCYGDDYITMYVVGTVDRVDMRQARLALLYSGLLPIVEQAIAGMLGVEGQAARIEWEFASTVARDNPLVVAMATVIGITSAQMDDLLTYAATIP
jgi:hypothetical protein